MALVRGDERTEREVYALHSGLVHLRGDALHRLTPAPAADAHAFRRDDADGGLVVETPRREHERGGRQYTN